MNKKTTAAHIALQNAILNRVLALESEVYHLKNIHTAPYEETLSQKLARHENRLVRLEEDSRGISSTFRKLLSFLHITIRSQDSEKLVKTSWWKR